MQKSLGPAVSCALLVALALIAPPAASAGTITVTNTNDSGAGSLRAAIAEAASGDTVAFARSARGTITLATQLVVTRTLTIEGPGVDALTISGNDATRVLFVNPGIAGAMTGPPAANIALRVSDLTIADGLARGADGGAQNAGGGAGGSAGMGGAVFVNRGLVTLSGLVIRGSTASGGLAAAISNSGGAGGGGFLGAGSTGAFGGADGDAGGAGGSGGLLGGIGGSGGASPGSNATTVGNPGGGGGDGAGGGGGSEGSACPRPSPPENCSGPGKNGGAGGAGGFGGGGGGGGRSGDNPLSFSGKGIGGVGGAGGFGGGGGGGGTQDFEDFTDRQAVGGAGGQFGGAGQTGNANGASGGGGAGLGGAVFLRAGSLIVRDSDFVDNAAAGGLGGQRSGRARAASGQGKGGALFLREAANEFSGCGTVSGNTATDAVGSGSDTGAAYGQALPALSPCDRTPSAAITAPAPDGRYLVGQDVPTGFACAPGVGQRLDACADDAGSAGPGRLDTATAGTKTYSVTATQAGGATRTTTITYTVLAPSPDVLPSPIIPPPVVVAPVVPVVPVVARCRRRC
jgi:hypothetical protein